MNSNSKYPTNVLVRKHVTFNEYQPVQQSLLAVPWIKLLKKHFPDSIQVSIEYKYIWRQSSVEHGWVASASLCDSDFASTPMDSDLQPTMEAAVNNLIVKRKQVKEYIKIL